MRRFRFSLNALLTVLLALAVSPLAAQLNPKWQAPNSPDFLDLYQRSSSTKVKPEIATVFDFSGSMATLMFHKDFNNTDTGDSTGTSVNFKLSWNSTTNRYNCTGMLTSPSGITSTISSGADSNLVRPDGSLVTAANVDTTAPTTLANGSTIDYKDSNGKRSGDVRNWIMACSHIRVTYNSREIDLPVPWKILSADSTGYPLSSYTCPDPVVSVKDSEGNVLRTYGSGTEIEMDRNHLVSPGSVFVSVSTDWQGNMYATVSDAAYRSDYVNWIFNKLSSNPSTIETTATKKAFANGIPARTRVQAVKEAAIRTWVKYQDKVLWAFRFLNIESEYQDETNFTSIFQDSRNPLDPKEKALNPKPDPTKKYSDGRTRVWTMLNNTTAAPDNSVNGMKIIASLFANNGTPLTSALANTLAQFTDPNSVFNDFYNSTGNAVYDCGNHCVILFTDGVPNSDGNNVTSVDSPYISASTLAGNANDGNKGFGGSTTPSSASKSTTMDDRSGTYWNISNLAAIAAHGVPPASKTSPELTTYWDAPASYPTSGAPSSFIPFAITKRNGTSFKTPHPVQVMTVGVSLGGTSYTATTGPKRRLFQTAALGDPNMTSWNLNNLKPFYQTDPNDPESPKAADAVYFFDAASPDKLVTALDQAFKAASASQQTASTSLPVIPWIGSGLGNQIYLAAFTVPKGGGPVWTGDLMMFPTKDVTLADPKTGSKTQTLILDNAGNEIKGDLATEKNPGWSAAKALTSRVWTTRKIYTRLPSSSTDANPAIYSIPTSITATDLGTTGSQSKLAAILPGADAAAKLKNLQWMMGADVASTATTKPTRSDIMGDILDSAPSFLEYSNPTLSGSLSTAWAAAPTTSRHFRVVFVGTNQGVIHAFGEVVWDNNVGTTSKPVYIKAGVVDELWAFIPTDVIKYCDHYQKVGDPHYFGVNGTPYLYFLDLPASGKRSGNGMMDIGSSERATLIMGLGKGGRSYYALDVRDPFAPKLGGSSDNKGWALVPDESTSYPDSIFETTIKNKTLIANMGWSTCQPTVGRVLTGTGSTQVVRDAVFLGGGFSLPEIEKNYPTTGADTKLGRSVLALDVNTGHVMGYWDLSGAGPVGAGVMPMTVIPYSGMTQRAYFTDFFGGLWALGCTTEDSRADYKGFRVDSSNMWSWASSARPVYHQDRPDGLLSTLPAPFLVSNFYPRTTAPLVSPLTVGVTLVSGDRNNPMDQLYTGVTGNTKPSQHRLTVVFDRQDSNKLGLDTAGITTDQLADMSSQNDPDSTSIQPGNSDFYLNTKYGYYLNFPARAAKETYVAKGLVTPTVLSGKLYYSYFSPQGYEDNNPCNNGTGATSTVQVCNVMTPTVPGTGKAWDSTLAVQGCASGEVFSWTGLASRFSPKSILAVLQAGVVAGSDGSASTLKIKSFDGTMSKAIAGPKVWRTVR